MKPRKAANSTREMRVNLKNAGTTELADINLVKKELVTTVIDGK